jgi:hypothetical protein
MSAISEIATIARRLLLLILPPAADGSVPSCALGLASIDQKVSEYVDAMRAQGIKNVKQMCSSQTGVFAKSRVVRAKAPVLAEPEEPAT